MKRMKILAALLLSILIIAVVSAVAMAAEAVAPASAAGQTSVNWFVANATPLLGSALAISESLALIPGIKENGILDIVIKLLSLIVPKNDSSQQG